MNSARIGDQPALTDLHCWLWAAIPPRGDKINITRAADRLGLSRTTLRRWLQSRRHIPDAQLIRLRQLAILRGHGSLLWPGLDASSIVRLDSQLNYAERCNELISTDPDLVPAGWRESGAMDSHSVVISWWPSAQVHTITVTRTDKTLTKINSKHGQAEKSLTRRNKWAAELIKYRTLDLYRDHLRIVPRALVYYGRTEAISGVEEPQFATG